MAMQRLCMVARARDEALAELQALSPRLHARAQEIDLSLWPIEHPQMTETPPTAGHRPAAAL